MENNGTPWQQNPSSEGIDLSKLWMTIKNNLLWVVGIVVIINLLVYLLFIRYSPDLYESHSEIKLDIKDEASELGIKTLVDDQNINIMSGEIELIQSRLFLNRVMDSLRLEVSYFNKGEILNHEFFGNSPYEVAYTITRPEAYNVPVYMEQATHDNFVLRQGDEGPRTPGSFGKPVGLKGMEVVITRKAPVAANVDLNFFFVINSPEVLMNYLTRNLSVQPLNFNANTIRISFKDHNPVKATRIVNKIDSLYLHFSNELKNQANRQKITWLTNELNQIEDKMGQYENYFESFILENKTNDLDKELSNTISVIHAIDSQRFEMSRRINEVNQITDQIAQGTFFVGAAQQQFFPPVINQKLDQLNKLQSEFDQLSLSYKEVTFAFRERQQQLVSLQQEVASQLSELKQTWLDKLQHLNRQKSQLEREFALMPDRNTQFNKNQRFYKLYEEFYLMLMQSKSQFEIAQAGTTPDFKILSPASLSYAPIAPNKPMIMGIGLVASLFLSLLFIGVMYLTNNRITGMQEIEQLNLAPMLGVVPVSSDNSGGLHVVDHPRSMVSEAFRTLRTNLDFFQSSSRQKVVAISSTVAGEGKSYIALNLGAVMAMSRKKVILLDLDMRKARKSLGIGQQKPDQGVSTVLIRKNSWQECLVRTSVENFDYLPSGPQPPNPSELLLNGAFSTLLEELKKEYDFIILDTPPVGLVTDGIMAMKQADVSIYVFRANYSRKEFLQNLRRTISIHKFTSVTTLLNAMPVKDKSIYGYGYYEQERPNKLKSILKI